MARQSANTGTRATDLQNLAENRFVADKLGEMADLLEQQAASPFRVRAYREAASFISVLTHPIRSDYLRGGRQGLEDLPTIGPSIASAVAELLDTGRLTTIDRLRGSTDAEKLFQIVPMIGPALAQSIHDDLGIDTLEALEAAAHDGRLATVKGIGRRRVESISHSLADILTRRRPRRGQADTTPLPIAEILAVDETYRRSADQLPSIRPRRFNPTGDIRLPILHTDVGDWHFTALYSNTPSAHRYGKSRDWVVVYCERPGQPERQVTVVTEHGGALDGMRVIRGHEAACAALYARPSSGTQADSPRSKSGRAR
jgi:hypothetical protein